MPVTLSILGREVLRFGRADGPAITTKIPPTSPMGNIFTGLGANRWGFPAAQNKAQKLAAYTGYVHTCANARAQRDGAAKYQLLDKRTGDVVPEDVAPIPYAFFRKPNPVMSEYFLGQLISLWLNLCGTAPVLKVRNAAGVPVMQWPLLPNRVTALYDPVDWVRYEYLDDSGKIVKIPGHDLIYYRRPHPTKLFDGLGLLEGAGLFADTDALLWQFQREMFSKGPFSSWILQYPTDVRFEDGEESAIAENFEQIVGNRERPAFPVVLGQGVEAKSFPVTNKGMEVPTINEEIKERIRSAFGTSRAILGETSAETFANAEGGERSFARLTETYLRLIDDERERSVLPEWDERYQGDFEAVTPDDKAHELEEEKARLDRGVLTINEVREDEGWDTVPWGDEPRGPAFVAPLLDTGDGAMQDEGDEPAPAPVPTEDVQAQALNGLQVESLSAIIDKVGTGTMSKPTAAALIAIAFPSVASEQITALLDGIVVKEPAPEPPPIPPKPEPPKPTPPEPPVEKSARAGAPVDHEARRAEHWRAFVAMQGPVEIKVAGIVRKQFARHEAEVLRRLEEKAPRFLDTLAGWTRKHAEQHLARRSVVDDIANLSEFAAEFREAVQPNLVALYTAAGKKAAASVPKSGVSFVVNDKGIKQIANHLKKSTDIVLKTSADAIKATLREGFLAGEGVGELSARIRDLYDGMSRGRAETIARTETVAPANLGAVEGYKQAGVERIEWITTTDGSERESHAEMNGKVIPVGAKFHVPAFGNTPAATMEFPGDGDVPGQVINCRCAVAGVIGEETD